MHHRTEALTRLRSTKKNSERTSHDNASRGVTLSQVSHTVASTSRSRATFQSELIERSTEDDLPDNVKGTAVYKSFPDQEGYYVFDKHRQGYIPIHFLEDKRLWVLIDYDDKVHSWYTTEPAPLEYGRRPHQQRKERYTHPTNFHTLRHD